MVLNLNEELSPCNFIYTFSVSESGFFLGQESWFSSYFSYRLYPKLFHCATKLLKDCAFSHLHFPYTIVPSPHSSYCDLYIPKSCPCFT